MFKQLLKDIDRSTWLKERIKWLSATLAAQRGLPMIVAIVLTVISLIIHVVAALSQNVFVSVCGFSLLHVAIITGLVGMLLTDPLGRG